MLVNDSSTTSKRSLWPAHTRNLWVLGAWESRLRLSNDLVYDDWASALGANTLGYRQTGPLFQPAASLPWQIEHDFADQFCQAMGTEAVRFFKSGSDAVSCAVRLARAYADRDVIAAFPQCYHGTGDWFGPALWTKAGIATDPYNLCLLPFGQQIKLFQDTRDIYKPTDIAAIVLEPAPKSIILPPDGWLQHLREVCDEHGILLISDEIILGYRHSLQGYMHRAGVQADLYCYGKAMAQGAALSACTGSAAILGLLAEQVHFSGTNNGEPLPLNIAQWALAQYQEHNICAQLDHNGAYLRQLLTAHDFETRGLNERFEVAFDSSEQRLAATAYCFDHGVLFPGFCSMAVTHTEDQMQHLVATLVNWRATL